MAKVIAVDLEVNTKKSEANLNDVVAVLGDIKKGLENNTKATTDNAKATKTLETNFQKAARGVKGFGLALKAAGIGLAIEAFTMFKEVLGENQKVADFFAASMEGLSIAFNDFFKFIESNFGAITGYFKDIFENPKENLEEFADAIKNNLIERFNSFIDTLGFLATAVKKVFERDFAGALEAVKQAGKESVDILTGVNNSVDKAAEIIPKVANAISDYAKSTYDAAAASVKLNKQAEIAAVINQGLIEDYDRQAEQQRQIRDDTRNSLEERIAANNKLGEVLEEQQKLMIENADLVVRAAESDFQKNNNQENYINLLQAENERKAVLAQIEGFRSEQLVNQAALEQEVADKKKEIDEAEIERKKELADAVIQAEEEKRKNIYATLDAASEIAGEDSKIARALFLFKQGLIVKEQIANAKATLKNIIAKAAEAKVDAAAGAAKTASAAPFPANIPLLIGFGAQIAGITATIFSAVRAAKSATNNLGGGGVNIPSNFGGGGGGGFALGGGFSPSTPTITALPNANTINSTQPSNVRAYVVQTDINNQTALDKRINQRATLWHK